MCSWSIRFLILIIICLISKKIDCGPNDYTYSFKLSETDLSNFTNFYSISVVIYVNYLPNGIGQFKTNVYNLSPLHFSMFANDENCGILSRVCTFNLQKGETLQIKIVKIDQATKLLTFLYIDQNQEPQINAGKCPVTFPGLDPVRNCVAAEEIHSDTIGNSYLGDFCICGAPSADCSPTIANDSCISNQPWWHQDNPSSSTSTTPTTIVTTSRPSTTTKPSLTTESTSTSTSRSTPRSTSTSTSRSTPSSTSTTSQTSTSTTSMTSPTTSTLSSTTKISTTVTTTQSTPLPTTTQTTSTNFPPSPTSTPTLKNLSDSGVGINNVSTILNETLVYSKMGPNLNSTQVFEISTILYNSCNVPGLTVNNSLQILQNLDNILNVNEETFYQSGTSSSQLLSMLPSMVHNTENHRIDYLEGLNLGFTAKKVDCTNLDHDDGILDLGTRFELLNSSSKISETHQNSIVIPLSDLCGTQDLTHVFFTIYRQKSLFVGQQQYNIYNGKSTPLGKQTMILNGKNGMGNRVRRDAENQTQTPAPSACSRQTSLINSPVLSATILNNGVTLKTTTSQATMAVLKFNTTGIQKPLHGQLKVTWWDTGRQLWATDRQCTIISDENGIVTANCLHLTDFAIIVDAALNDPNVCDTALIDLGYVVNGFSIVALIFLSVYSISTYNRSLSSLPLFKYLHGHSLVRRDFISLAYHLDLFLFYLLFTIFSNQDTSGSLCTTMAAIMYALLLCSLLLTIFQGIRNILTFLSPKIYRFVNILLSSPSVLSFSVVIPFSISILLLVFTNFFDRQDCFCWVRPDYIVFAIVVPVTVLLLNTLFCSSLIIYKVFFGMRRKLSSREGNHHYDPNFTTKIVSIIIMQISLGLPWILQFGTLYSPYTTFWHYLFTIVMGSQGTMLLLIFFYKRYKIRIYESEQRSSSRQAKSIEKRVIHSTDEETLDNNSY